MLLVKKQLSKHGHDHVLLLQTSLVIHLVFTMENLIFQYLSLKIWYDTNLASFLLLVYSALILVTSSLMVGWFDGLIEKPQPFPPKTINL